MLILEKENVKENWFGEKVLQDANEEILKFWNILKEREANYPLKTIKAYLAPKDILILDYKRPLNQDLMVETKETVLKSAGMVSEFDFLNKKWIKDWCNDYETFNKCEQEIYAFLNHISRHFESLERKVYEDCLKNYFRYQNRQVGQSDSHCIVLEVEGFDFVHLFKMEDKENLKITVSSFKKSAYEEYYYDFGIVKMAGVIGKADHSQNQH